LKKTEAMGGMLSSIANLLEGDGRRYVKEGKGGGWEEDVNGRRGQKNIKWYVTGCQRQESRGNTGLKQEKNSQ